MTAEELQRLLDERAGRLAAVEELAESKGWAAIAEFIDAQLRSLEHEGKGLRRRLMRPVKDQPPVTLEQIASHEARLDERAILRRLPTFVIGLWRDQLEQLLKIRDERPR